jgi:hypothetical protein
MAQLTPISTTAVTGTSFADTDTAIQTGARQVYAVAAVGADGKQGPLTAVLGGIAISPPSPLPNYTLTVFGHHTEGTCTDLGTSVGAFMDQASGTVTLRGGGTDFWSDHEDLVLLSTPETGNFRMTVQLLTSPLGISTCCSKAGLIVREGLKAEARYVMSTVRTDGLRQQRRTSTDVTAPDDNEGGDSGIDGPALAAALQAKGLFLQVVRTGDNIATNFSLDGKTFTPIDSGNDPNTSLTGLAANVQVGLVLAARDRDAVIQNRLSEVQFKIISIDKL